MKLITDFKLHEIMKKKKLSLQNLEVTSFVTNLSTNLKLNILGGVTIGDECGSNDGCKRTLGGPDCVNSDILHCTEYCSPECAQGDETEEC